MTIPSTRAGDPVVTVTGSWPSSCCETWANGVVLAGSKPAATWNTRPRTGTRAVVPMVLLASA